MLDKSKSEVDKVASGARTFFTGDDGMIFPGAAQSRGDKLSMLKRFSQVETPVRPRVVFLGPKYRGGVKIPASDRQALVVTGESFEKDLQRELSRRLGDETTESFTMGFDMQASVMGNVTTEVLVTSPISPQQEKILRELVTQLGAKHGFTRSGVYVLPRTSAATRRVVPLNLPTFDSP